MIYNQIKDIILDDLAQNRSYYKEKIKLLQDSRNVMIDEDKNDILYNDILDGYEIALQDLILDEILEKYPNYQIDDVWCILEDLDLANFFEPEN